MKFWGFAVVVSLSLNQTSPDLLPASRVPIEERLWVAELGGWSNDPLRVVFEELHKACTGSADPAAYLACQKRIIRPARYLVATLHAAPSEQSPVVASIYQETILSSDDRLAVTNIDRASRPGERLEWPDAAQIGDYGLHIAGVQRRGDWVRLLTSVPVDGWLRIMPVSGVAPRLAADISLHPLTYSVIEMSPLRAVWPDGRSRMIDQGSYVVLKVDGASVQFRAEVPSDFACGESVTDPVPSPPTLTAPTSELFNRDGSGRFAEKYTKGC